MREVTYRGYGTCKFFSLSSLTLSPTVGYYKFLYMRLFSLSPLSFSPPLQRNLKLSLSPLSLSPPLQRNLTFSCSESNSFSIFFNSTSFLRLPGQSDSDTLSVSMSFRTWNPNGLLMFTALADGWVEVGLTEGKVTVYMNVTQKKNSHIDISSGEIRSLIFIMNVKEPPVSLVS